MFPRQRTSMFQQLIQMHHYLTFNPGKYVNVVTLNKNYREQLLAYAKQAGIKIKATKTKRYGKDSWTFGIKSIDMYDKRATIEAHNTDVME